MTTSRLSLSEIAQTLAAYVAIPGALVYPFGFFALFVQFAKYFGLDFYTAWYAASMVNKMVAIGQGVTILVLALVGSVLLSAKIAQMLLKHKKSGGPRRFVRRRGRAMLITVASKLAAVFTLSRFVRRGMLSMKLIGLFLLTLGLYIVYSRILAGGRVTWFVIRGRESTECDPVQVARHQLNLWPDSLVPALIFFAGCLIGGWLIYRSYQLHRYKGGTIWSQPAPNDYRMRLEFFKRGVTEGWILSGLAAAYAFSVLASVWLAAYTPAFMPYMTYGSTIQYKGGKEPTDNRFLSHAEGQWYLLHRVEEDKNHESPREYRIVSIAEGQVEHVRVSPNPPLASRVAPLPFGLGIPLPDQAKDHCES